MATTGTRAGIDGRTSESVRSARTVLLAAGCHLRLAVGSSAGLQAHFGLRLAHCVDAGIRERSHPIWESLFRRDETTEAIRRHWERTMSVKPDSWIKTMALGSGMIEPFEDSRLHTARARNFLDVMPRTISYGVSSYGYDVTLADEFKVFTNVFNTVVDPKGLDPRTFVDLKTDVCLVPPNSFALARTVEYLRIPRDILVICLGKSTYARCGIIVNVTPLEPEWEGHITIEISNTTPLPAKIYAHEGIAQLLFLQGDGPCDISYKDKLGKYQKQRGITLPR